MLEIKRVAVLIIGRAGNCSKDTNKVITFPSEGFLQGALLGGLFDVTICNFNETGQKWGVYKSSRCSASPVFNGR
jgi:hypothetical protein